MVLTHPVNSMYYNKSKTLKQILFSIIFINPTEINAATVLYRHTELKLRHKRRLLLEPSGLTKKGRTISIIC